ncbi:MAG: hypothetical protein DMG02_25450 [Acidobacteria bacterium]|nr:MAG: hypothetical protein DMG02_25450 [Acidobacteriota bacterium]
MSRCGYSLSPGFGENDIEPLMPTMLIVSAPAGAAQIVVRHNVDGVTHREVDSWRADANRMFLRRASPLLHVVLQNESRRVLQLFRARVSWSRVEHQRASLDAHPWCSTEHAANRLQKISVKAIRLFD